MAVPTVPTFAAHAGNPTTSATITLPATQADDILVLVGVNGGATAALTGPTGTYSGGAWNATGLAAAMTASWGGSWWSRCTGNHSGQTVILSGATDSCSAAVIVVSGAITSGSPLDTNTSATTLTANGMALAAFNTVENDDLVVFCCANDDNIAHSGETMGGVAMTEHVDASSTGGADSGVVICSLGKATAGSTGAFAGTHASTLSKRLMAFAIKPEPDPAAVEPSTPVLDDFNRADENPVSQSGNWVGPLASSDVDMQVLSNQLANSDTGAFTFASAVYDETVTDGEVYVTTQGTATQLQYLYIRTAGEGGSGTLDGYCIEVTGGNWRILREDNAVQTALGATFSQAVSAGDSIGLKAEGSRIEAWYKASGGSWTRLAWRTDSTYTSGRIGIRTNGPNIRWDDFGGGTPSAGVTRKQLTALGVG